MANNKKVRGFVTDIEKDVLDNKNFRKVLYTSKHSQLVLMTLLPNQEIGMEVHPKNDQFFRFESGNGLCIINGHKYKIKDGTAVIVPAGANHNIINTSSTKKLKMYTIYSPAHHRDQVLHKTKQEAESDNEKFNGKTTE